MLLKQSYGKILRHGLGRKTLSMRCRIHLTIRHSSQVWRMRMDMYVIREIARTEQPVKRSFRGMQAKNTVLIVDENNASDISTPRCFCSFFLPRLRIILLLNQVLLPWHHQHSPIHPYHLYRCPVVVKPLSLIMTSRFLPSCHFVFVKRQKSRRHDIDRLESLTMFPRSPHGCARVAFTSTWPTSTVRWSHHHVLCHELDLRMLVYIILLRRLNEFFVKHMSWWKSFIMLTPEYSTHFKPIPPPKIHFRDYRT